MMIANIYGRCGQDAQARTTKNGKPMATCSVAVDVTGQSGEPETMWVSILAFGYSADAMLQAARGQMVAAIGKMSRGKYMKDGVERESWSMMADAVVVVGQKGAVTSAGREKSNGDNVGGQKGAVPVTKAFRNTYSPSAPSKPAQKVQDPFDDDIPF
jgi:single-strand DNA-binding protein